MQNFLGLLSAIVFFMGVGNLLAQTAIPFFIRLDSPDVRGCPVDGWGYLDETGRLISTNLFPHASSVDGTGISLVEHSGQLALFRPSDSSIVLFPPESDVNRFGPVPIWGDSIGFSEGRFLARFYDRGTGYCMGYFGYDGNLIDGGKWKQARSFRNGLAAVSNGKQWGFIDPSGKLVVSNAFDRVSDFSDDGLAVATIEGNRVGLIDPSGRWVLSPRYHHISGVSGGIAAVNEGGKSFFVGLDGRKVLESEFDEADPFHDGLAWVRIGGVGGYIMTNGTFAIHPKYDDGFSFSEGLAAVRMGEKWGYVTTNGTVAIPFLFDGATCFSGGFAKVVVLDDEPKTLLIGKNGKTVFPKE